MNRTHVVERAYQLARTNDCLNTGDVVKALSGEGYSGAEISHFQGSSIRADLNRICKMPKPDAVANADADADADAEQASEAA